MCETVEDQDTCQYCGDEMSLCQCQIFCVDCNCGLGEHQILDGQDKCEACVRNDAEADWMIQTIAEVERLAAKHGWSVEGSWHRAGTGSQYATLTRGVWINEGTDDEDFLSQDLKVRVSDHGSCYCSEDISIAMNPSGDDHCLATLAAVLAKPFEAD